MKTLLFTLGTLFCFGTANMQGGPLDDRPGERWSIHGRVLQLVKDGALIQAKKTERFGMKQPETGAIVYVTGKLGSLVDDDKVDIVGELAGTYEYGSVIGAKKTVRAFTIVSIRKIEN